MTESPTCDPYVVIEQERPGFVVYKNILTGRRWSVDGVCDYRGNCMIGVVEPWPPKLRKDRLDVPVTPEFFGCCPFTFVELESA